MSHAATAIAMYADRDDHSHQDEQQLAATAALTAHNVSHRFGEFEALAPTTFTLRGGEMAVVSGPNGAGKTTLLLCLSGLLPPTTGSIRVEGYDLYDDEREAKRRLAFVPDVPRFYAGLNAWEHMQFMALAHGVSDFEGRARELLQAFGLWRARQLFPHALSRGMQLKLGLLAALIRPFKVLMLDEPSSALDPESTALLKEKLLALREQGAAILLTTHDTALSEQMESALPWRVEDGRLIRP